MTITSNPLTDLLREVPLFSSLTAQELERLGESLVPIELEEGEWLYQAGEPTTGVYLVESGSLALVEKGSGQQSLCRRAAIVRGSFCPTVLLGWRPVLSDGEWRNCL